MDDVTHGPRPPRRDVMLAAVFGGLSLAQVLIEPIAGTITSLVVALGSTLPLAWRHRYPAAAAVAGSVIWLIPTPGGFLLLGFVIAALLYYCVGSEVRSLHVVVTVAALGTCIGVVATLRGPEPPPTALGAALAVVGPTAAGRLMAHQRTQNARLRDLAAQLANERKSAERAAVAEERARIARELHDVIGHEVSVIALQADAAAAALARAPERAAVPVAAIRRAATDVLTEMRSVLGVLRTDAENDRRPQPGLSDLPDLVQKSRSAGARVSLTVRPVPGEVPATVQLAAYRLVQEALTNAGRHAPGASVRVDVDADDTLMVVQVVDSGGQPATSPGTGLGLVGMRERIRLLGGELHAGPRDAGGFTVTARLPLDTRAAP